MQCFRVGYREICQASLVFSVYTRAFRRMWKTFAEIEQECVLSNFELKFDFLERLKTERYEKTAKKSKTMKNVSFGRKM